MRRLRAWARRAVISLLNDDTSDDATVQCSYNGVATAVNRFSPYGLSANPPVNSKALIVYPSGRQDNPIAIADNQPKRFKELKEGEVQVGNYLTRASIKFDEDGNMIVAVPSGGKLTVETEGGDADITIAGGVNLTVTGDVKITAPTVAITGNLTVTGTVTATGDVIGLLKSLATHIHTSAAAGQPTSPPT